VILSYCTLASELEKSGMGHLSLDWYQRAYQVASKFFLENAILQELKKLIDLSSGNNNNNPHDSRNPNSAQLSYREGTVTSSNERGIAEDNNNNNNNNNNTATEKEKVSARGARPRSALPRLSKVKMNNNDDNQTASYNNDDGNTNNPEQKKNHQPFSTNINSNSNPASYLPDKNGPESPDRNDYDLPRPKSAVSKLGGGYQQNLGGSASYPNSRNNSPSHRHQPSEQSQQQQQFFPPEEDEEDDHHHYGQRSQQQQQQQQQRPVSRQPPPQLRLPQQQQQQYYNSNSRQQQQHQQSQQQVGERNNSSNNNHLYDRYNLFLHPDQQQQQQANSNKISPTNYAQTTTASPLPFPHYRSVPSEPILPTYDPYEHHQQGGRGQQQQQQPQLNTLQVSHSSPLLINPSQHSIVLLPSGSITSLNNTERKRPKSSSGQQRIEPRKTLASELLARKKQEFANSVENSQSKNSTLSFPSGTKRPSSSNSPNRVNRNQEEPETDDRHYHQHDDNLRMKTSKSNKTLISKVLHETTHSRKTTSPGKGGGSRPSSAVVNREKEKEKETSNHPSSNKETVPSSSSNNMAMSYHTPQNPLLAIDEFGKEKIRKVAEFCFPYFKGLRIEAKYQIHRIGDRGYWYPGRIIKADFIQGLYDVEFENGDREKNISVENIRIPEYASKLLLLQSTTKNVLSSSSGKSNNNKDENQGESNKEEEGGGGGDSGHRIPARVLRKQFDDDMHSAALKLLAGINQRSDQRKMERIQLKNTLVTRIQSLLRGVLLRLRFPKIRQQVEREKELRRKENELIEMERQINESRNKACQTIEVQTGESLLMLDTKEPFEGGQQDNNNNTMLRPQTTEDILFINNGNVLSPSSRNKPHPPPLVQQPFVTRPQPVQPILPPTSSASPYVHHLPPPLAIYNSLPYNQQQHQQLLDQTLNVTNNNDSFPETPYGMDGINTLMGLDDIQERSVHHGKFINDSSPTHLDETAIFRGSESDIILIPRTNEEEMMLTGGGGEGGDANLFLQQKFHEMANLNNTLYFIQEEQKDLKQLDMKRNQEMLMQFHSLHQLLLLQTEELKQLKKDENKRKVELELYIQTLLNQQQKNLQSFQAQHLQQIEQELEVIHHEQQQQQHNQVSQLQQEKEKQQPEQLPPKPSHTYAENTNQVPVVLSTPTFVPSSEEVSPQDLKPTSSFSPRHNPNPSNGKTRTIKVPESSITLEVSVENSLIKPDDQHLLEEYGQLGVEDFWNSISSADFPLPLKPMKEPVHPTQNQNHATIEDHYKKQLINQQQSSTSGNGSLDMDAIDHSLLSQMNNIPSDNNSHVSGGKSYPRNLEQINETAVE
jgi:hypothetical protein